MQTGTLCNFQEMGAEIEHLDSEKETIEKTLIMIQNEYKEAKLETQVCVCLML